MRGQSGGFLGVANTTRPFPGVYFLFRGSGNRIRVKLFRQLHVSNGDSNLEVSPEKSSTLTFLLNILINYLFLISSALLDITFSSGIKLLFIFHSTVEWVCLIQLI